jgi:outer membrane lipoprotein-sorting protein
MLSPRFFLLAPFLAAACQPRRDHETLVAPMVSVAPMSPVVPDASTASGVSDPYAAVAIEGLETFYAKVRPFEAELVVQPVSSQRRSSAASLRARLVFDGPGRMRISFYDGALIVIAGGVQAAFNPQTRHVLQEKVALDHCPAFVAFACPLGRSLTFKRRSDDKMDADSGKVLVGATRSPDPLVAKVLLYLDDLQGVRRAVVVNASGEGLQIDISAVRSVVPPSDTFVMSVPQGASIATVPDRSLYRSPLP